MGRVFSARKNRIMPSQKHTGGYRKVSFTINSVYHNRYVHRLVAEAFLPKWTPELQVNHIDGNKTNNNVENLEMVTPSENIQHAHDHNIGGAHHLHHKGGNHAKPVLQYTLDGQFIARYSSTYKAQQATGASSGNLSHVADGTRKSAGGYCWKWDER